MAADFHRVITLLRKEKGITQKQAAQELGISQALLSHYEKGIRECGLDFVVKLADYYQVSCDYLLGRSEQRDGLMLNIEDIPAPEQAKNSAFRGSILPMFHKKLIFNSLNIVYDQLNSCPNKALVTEMSQYFMLAVYKMFRSLYEAHPKNAKDLFRVKDCVYQGYSDAMMQVKQANVYALLQGQEVGCGAPVKDTKSFEMTTQYLQKEYPLYATSLFNLIKNTEEQLTEQHTKK